MKCPLCQVEMRITKSRYVVEDEEEVRLFIEQDMTCVNKYCSNYNTVVETTKTEIPIG